MTTRDKRIIFFGMMLLVTTGLVSIWAAAPTKDPVQYRIAWPDPSSWTRPDCGTVKIENVSIYSSGLLQDWDDGSGKAFFSGSATNMAIKITDTFTYSSDPSQTICFLSCPTVNTSEIYINFGNFCTDIHQLGPGCRQYSNQPISVNFSQDLKYGQVNIGRPNLTDSGAMFAYFNCPNNKGYIDFTLPEWRTTRGLLRPKINYHINLTGSREGIIPQLPNSCLKSAPAPAPSATSSPK